MAVLSALLFNYTLIYMEIDQIIVCSRFAAVLVILNYIAPLNMHTVSS